MRKIAIIGIGQTKVDEHWQDSVVDLAVEAVQAAKFDAGREDIESLFVSNMMSGTLNQQLNLAALVADRSGLKGVEATHIEAACGSGGVALRQAMLAVASGEVASALVVGVEKMTDTLGSETTKSLAMAADADYELAQGATFVALNALIMQRYMYEYGWKHEDFAPFAVNAHANAVHNPYARLRKAISAETFTNARMIASPVGLFDASATGDGAAAVVIVPYDSVGKSASAVTIAGSAVAVDTVSLHDRKDGLWLTAAEQSAKRAYAQANIQPADVDFFELHDAFSIMAALSLEACGFAERGKGPRVGLERDISPQGELPLSTHGGLKARGHPVGATGIYQVVEATQQLRGTAGALQVPDAEIGLVQNIGGAGTTIATHVLARVN